MSKYDNLDVSFYDRATNEPIEPLTNPKYCIEPIAQMTMYKQGKKFAALTELPTRNVTHSYKKTLKQRLLRQKATNYTRREFDFDTNPPLHKPNETIEDLLVDLVNEVARLPAGKTINPKHYTEPVLDSLNTHYEALVTKQCIKELERYLENADPDYIDYEYIKPRISELKGEAE